MGLRDYHPAVLATALATFGSFLGIVDPILPSIARELGASHFMVMFLFTSYLLVMGVANLIAGALATRIGSKRTMLLGLATVAVFAGGCALVSTVESLAILRGFWGLGNALFTTALTIMVGVSAAMVVTLSVSTKRRWVLESLVDHFSVGYSVHNRGGFPSQACALTDCEHTERPSGPRRDGCVSRI